MGRGRAPCCDKNQVKKGPWSPAEDLRLISFIQKHGHGNWRSLPKQSGLLRCGKSCRLRWINYLRPDVKRGNFTPEEEEAVIKLHDSLGNKWSKIASHLPGRTDNEIKNVWNTHLKKRTLKKDANCGNKDETKGSSIISSSSLPSSSSSNISYGDQKREKGLGDQDFVAKKPHEKQDPSTAISSPTDEPKEASSSSSSISSCASREEMGSLFNFEGVNEVHNAIHEAADHDVSDEMIEIPLESDIDFWNMLDNMDLFQSSETQPQPFENSQCSNFGEEHDREVECRKWMRYLENELGLVGTTSEDQDNPQNNSDHEEMMLKPSSDMGLGYFPMWPSSPQNFGI